MYIDKTEIEQLEKQKRVHLINSLGGFKSVALVGTADENKNTNLSIFSSFFQVFFLRASLLKRLFQGFRWC